MLNLKLSPKMVAKVLSLMSHIVDAPKMALEALSDFLSWSEGEESDAELERLKSKAMMAAVILRQAAMVMDDPEIAQIVMARVVASARRAQDKEEEEEGRAEPFTEDRAQAAN